MISLAAFRHASTDWNKDRLIQGRTDVALSADGLEAASRWQLPSLAAGWPCLSSPLRRTMETARAMGLDPAPAVFLAEMDWGQLEGRRLADIRVEGGVSFAANEARGLDFRPPGGESPREVGARVLAGLRDIRTNTVLVTHKGVLRAMLALATGWDMRAKAPVRLADACCHRFALDPDGRLHLTEPNMPLVPAASTPPVLAVHRRGPPQQGEHP